LAGGLRHAAAWKPCEAVQRVFRLLLRNHNASWSSKLDQARIDREPHNSCSLAFAPSSINGRDKFTKRQRLLLAVVSHASPLRFAHRTRPSRSQPDRSFSHIPCSSTRRQVCGPTPNLGLSQGLATLNPDRLNCSVSPIPWKSRSPGNPNRSPLCSAYPKSAPGLRPAFGSPICAASPGLRLSARSLAPD